MITIKCAKCKEDLEEFGGLLFTPPHASGFKRPVGVDEVFKYHLCVECTKEVEVFILGGEVKGWT
jgi:hypothetical protein